jgi:NTP pyrophosphatase (non-canonical NTP hydrolase)
MKKIIDLNYKSIVARGLITPKTGMDEFLAKIDEEVAEFKHEVLHGTDVLLNEELADIILVFLAMAKHYTIDIEYELKKKIRKNLKRIN